MMFLIFQPLILMIANRMRDGWITEIFSSPANPINIFFTRNSQMGRLLLWALPFAACLITQAHWDEKWYFNIFYFICLWLAAFGGAASANWGIVDHPAMGKTKPVWTFKNLISLGWWGMVFTGIPGVFAGLAQYSNHVLFGLAVILSGLMIIPGYVLCWAIKSKIPGFAQGTQLGSVLFALLAGIVLSIFSSIMH